MVKKTGWAVIENEQIIMYFDGLPRSWRNIHALDELDADELRDLSWAGHPHTAILPIIERKASCDELNEFLAGPYFSIGDGVVYADLVAQRYPFIDIPVEILGQESPNSSNSP
jgi:hypothetical protein